MDSITAYENLKQEKDVLYVIFFRGHWCPFCMSYLQEAESIREDIERNNGALIAITAEDESQFQSIRKVFAGTIISDSENKLAEKLRQEKLVDIAISEKQGYHHGMSQPGVLVMQKDKKLYSWAIVPSAMNLGGAKDRPSIQQIHENVVAQMAGKPQKHSVIKTQTFLQGIKFKIFG